MLSRVTPPYGEHEKSNVFWFEAFEGECQMSSHRRAGFQSDANAVPTSYASFHADEVGWRLDCAGITVGVHRFEGRCCESCMVPYWSAVLPLTLLSVWLLLGKQAEMKPTENSEK